MFWERKADTRLTSKASTSWVVDSFLGEHQRSTGKKIWDVDKKPQTNKQNPPPKKKKKQHKNSDLQNRVKVCILKKD